MPSVKGRIDSLEKSGGPQVGSIMVYWNSGLPEVRPFPRRAGRDPGFAFGMRDDIPSTDATGRYHVLAIPQPEPERPGDLTPARAATIRKTLLSAMTPRQRRVASRAKHIVIM